MNSKVLTLIAAGLVGFGASADVLYWQVGDNAPSTYATAYLSAVDQGGNTYYVSQNQFSTGGSGEAATPGNFANGGRFWKTYTAYNNGDGTRDINPYEMEYNGKRVTVLSGSGGFKLNPFSQDDRVITAALIGTPFDYYVASTNSNQTQSGGRRNTLVSSMSLAQMMSTYSFGVSSRAKMSSDELLDIAGAIQDVFRSRADNGRSDWLPGWDSLMWQEIAANRINDENKTFISTAIDPLSEPLHGVDRKYLYSFWRDCFDNRQQLFLIFVRAEPTSVGGGGMSLSSWWSICTR